MKWYLVLIILAVALFFSGCADNNPGSPVNPIGTASVPTITPNQEPTQGPVSETTIEQTLYCRRKNGTADNPGLLSCDQTISSTQVPAITSSPDAFCLDKYGQHYNPGTGHCDIPTPSPTPTPAIYEIILVNSGMCPPVNYLTGYGPGYCYGSCPQCTADCIAAGYRADSCGDRCRGCAAPRPSWGFAR